MCSTDYKQKNSHIEQGVIASIYVVYTHTHAVRVKTLKRFL